MTAERRTILGIDPGLAILGYGVIAAEADAVHHLAHGCVVSYPSTPVPVRLRALYEALVDIKDKFRVTDVALESLFYSRNVRTALAVGQARGVALLATVDDGTAFGEYTPTEVKQAIAGYGAATKRQMQEMIKLILALPARPSPDDAADALAVAVCHARRAALEKVLAQATADPPR